MPETTTIIYTVLISIFLFLWEHIAHVNKFTVRPTWPLSQLVLLSQTMFYHIGVVFGHIGSIITYLHLDQLIDTISYDIKLIYNLITSFRYIGTGIMSVAKLFQNAWQVYSASVIALWLIIPTIGLIIWFWFI